MDTFDNSVVEELNLTGEDREIYDTIHQFLMSIQEGESSNLRMGVCIALSNLIAGEKLPNIITDLPYERRGEFGEIIHCINRFNGSREILSIAILRILEHLTDKVCLLLPTQNKKSRTICNSVTTKAIKTL